MLLRYLFKLLFLVAIVGAGYLLYRTWSQYSFDDVMRALTAIPKSNLALALLYETAHPGEFGDVQQKIRSFV